MLPRQTKRTETGLGEFESFIVTARRLYVLSWVRACDVYVSCVEK